MSRFRSYGHLVLRQCAATGLPKVPQRALSERRLSTDFDQNRPFLWLLAEVKFCTMAQIGHCAKIAWSPGTMKKADFAQIWDIYRAQLAQPRPGVRALHGYSVLRAGLSPLSSPGHTKA